MLNTLRSSHTKRSKSAKDAEILEGRDWVRGHPRASPHRRPAKDLFSQAMLCDSGRFDSTLLHKHADPKNQERPAAIRDISAELFAQSKAKRDGTSASPGKLPRIATAHWGGDHWPPPRQMHSLPEITGNDAAYREPRHPTRLQWRHAANPTCGGPAIQEHRESAATLEQSSGLVGIAEYRYAGDQAKRAGRDTMQETADTLPPRSERSMLMSQRRREVAADIEEDKRLHALKMKEREEKRAQKFRGVGMTGMGYTPAIYISPTGYYHPSMHGS